MKIFKYKARDRQGKTYTGDVEAQDEAAAAKLVRDRKLFVISITSSRFGLMSMFDKLRYRVTPADVAVFTRQLATMVNAGLPVTEVLTILRVQALKNLQPIISQILADVEGGQSLSTALKKHPKVFSATYVALVKSGETGGVLDKVLARLSDNLEKQQEFKGKVRGALIYPVIIVVGMVVVSLIMVIFVIPRLTVLYTQFDADLPLTTRILMSVSDVFQKFWPLILLGMGIGIWIYMIYRKTEGGKLKLAKIFFKIPILGELKKGVIMVELTRTLSLMVGAGVPILEGISVTSDVIENVVISDALDDVGKRVEKGFPISFSFAKHPDAFPYTLSQMIAVGEETGKMEEVLLKVSRVFEVESEQKVKALTVSIEPLVMIILGIGVFFLVVSVILPIYNLTTAL